MEPQPSHTFGRRQFLIRAAKYSALGLSVPTLLQACSTATEDPAVTGTSPTVAGVPYDVDSYKEATKAVEDQAEKMVGDVLDFRLTSDDWEGPFGFAEFRLHNAAFDGNDVYFIRTDASEEQFASEEHLVWVPKLAPLAEDDGLAGTMYLFSEGADGQGAVVSAEPGIEAYTPVWKINRVTWQGEPRLLTSVSDVTEAQAAGDIDIEETDVIMNAPIVKWSDGELAVDPELKSYFPGQLISPPDTNAMTVTFKLNECFPDTRYIVTDHSIQGPADMTQTIFTPGLQGGATDAGATGRTNVFNNGLEGPGPLGFQPSAFDFAVGHASWSPLWDHWMYSWKNESEARLLRSQTEIHVARDAGELDEFPGSPNTDGVVFTVNCPSPVKAPNVYRG